MKKLFLYIGICLFNNVLVITGKYFWSIYIVITIPPLPVDYQN